MGWGVSKKDLEQHMKPFFSSSPSPLLCMWKHRNNQSVGRMSLCTNAHELCVEVSGSETLWWETRRDRINPREISLSENVCAQITIRVESLTLVVYQEGWHTNICLQLSPRVWKHAPLVSDTDDQSSNGLRICQMCEILHWIVLEQEYESTATLAALQGCTEAVPWAKWECENAEMFTVGMKGVWFGQELKYWAYRHNYNSSKPNLMKATTP